MITSVKVALNPMLQLVPLCLLVFAAAANAALVRLEFVVRVLPDAECYQGEQREPAVARALASPGSQIRGELEYDAAALRSPESNSDVADYYYFQPKHFRVSLSMGQKRLVNVSSNGTAWISSALLGRRLGQPKLGFTSDEKGDLAAWPGEIDRLVFQLVLRAKDDAPRMSELPSSAAINSMPLSSLSRLSLMGERSFHGGSQRHLPVWIVCGDLASLSAD